MLKTSAYLRFVACLLVITAVIPSRADDELDPAFRPVEPEGPLEIVPEKYPRSDWGTRYAADVTRYLKAHPSDEFAPRMCFDLIMVAQELNDRELELKGLQTLLLDYPRSIQALHALSTMEEPSEFLRLIKHCLADGEHSVTTFRKLVPVVEFGSKKWGRALWSHDPTVLRAAILSSLELDALETQAALEQEFSQPGQWDQLHLLETLRDQDATHEQLIAAIFDAKLDLVPASEVAELTGPAFKTVDFKGLPAWETETSAWPATVEQTVELFLPELGRRSQADGTEEFLSAITLLDKLEREQKYEEFLAELSTLLERYPSRRLEWTRILMLANLGRYEEARTAAAALNQDHPHSAWSTVAQELTGTFDGLEQLRQEQAELLAAVADRYRESDPSQLRMELFHGEFRTIEGNVIPPGSLIGEFDRARGTAMTAKMGDELVFQMVLGSDERLRLFLPSLNRSQIFVHEGDFSRYATIGIKHRYDSETEAYPFTLRYDFSKKNRSGFHGLRFDTSFPNDKAGYEKFLKLLQNQAFYPVSRREDGQTIEIDWKQFSFCSPDAVGIRWRSTPDGDNTSITIVGNIDPMQAGLTLSWGDENSSVVSGIELPDLPERTVPVLTMLPEYFEQIVWRAHKTGLLAQCSDRDVAQYINTRKATMYAYLNALLVYSNRPINFETVVKEFTSQEREKVLKRKFGGKEASEQESDEDKSDHQPDTFLEYVLPGNPSKELHKKLKRKK